MKLSEVVVIKNPDDSYLGKIFLGEELDYEVYGPFGQGFNIKVQSKNFTGKMNYHWKDHECHAKTNKGKYFLTFKKALQKKECVAEIQSNNELTLSTDQAVNALLILYHFYYHGMGPFQKNA